MIVCKCLSKERDSSGKILRYALQDACNHICIIGANELKARIRFKEINVINLQLTSDGRLIDKELTGPLMIPETDKLEYTKSMNEKEFMSANSYAFKTNPEPLHGWMDDDNGEYHESIYGIDGGVLEVSRLDWRIHLQPDRSQRIGVWVNPGFNIPGPGFDRFKENVIKNYAKAQAKANSNPNDTWSFEDGYDIVYKYSPGYLSRGNVKIWFKFSRIWIESQSELERFFDKIEPCKERVQEIREIKGWRSKKQRPVMRPDGTIETKGNWFNRFFGKK